MNNYILKYSLLIVLLVLVQVLVLNNIYFLGYLNPIIYILFIFVFPIKENKTPLLFFSFILGLLIDFFSNSGGSNAAAIVFIAYIRLPLLKLIQNNNEFDYLLFNIKKLNFLQILIYIFILSFLHHLLVFYLEYYTLKGFGYILLKTLYTSIFSSIIIGFSISLFVKNNNS
jgi:rod shape-determining protein MreD